MNIYIFEKLFAKGFISEQSLNKVKLAEEKKLFSIHWELRTILYLGVLLLTSGLGILIYKNIDTIGHQVVLAFIALLATACLYYCEKNKEPFSTQKVQTPSSWFDYILLLGCLTLLVFIGYLQVQYNVFGNRYGLATFIPMVILFFFAYYFDHLGVLSIAITNMGAWLGLAVTPLQLFTSTNFADSAIIFAGLAMGLFLTVAAQLSKTKNIKAHFSFTYLNFGMNILFVACIAGMFYFNLIYFLWLLPLAALCSFFYKRAMSIKSFYFILMITIYVYIGISYTVVKTLTYSSSELYMLVLMYFIISAFGAVFFLINMNKKLKS